MSSIPASPASSSSASTPPATFAPEDLFCGIKQDTMNKVATLVGCGHSFEEALIRQWNVGLKGCPLCKQVTSILPSDEEIQKMVRLAARRSELQAACDQHHLDHPEKPEDELPQPPILEAENEEQNDRVDGLLYQVMNPENGPHMTFEVDARSLPANLIMRAVVENIANGGFAISRSNRSYWRNYQGACPHRISTDPLQPTRVHIEFEPDSPTTWEKKAVCIGFLAGGLLLALAANFYLQTADS